MDISLNQLIDDIELLLKQDERFYLSNDHTYRSKIKSLSESGNFNNQSVDITPLINLAKINSKPDPVPLVIKKEPDLDVIRNIAKRIAQINDKLNNIIY